VDAPAAVSTGIDDNAWLGSASCAGITMVGCMWETRLYNRDPSR
jgi:hypothetical protein